MLFIKLSWAALPTHTEASGWYNWLIGWSVLLTMVVNGCHNVTVFFNMGEQRNIIKILDVIILMGTDMYLVNLY